MYDHGMCGMCDHGMCDHVLSLQGELKMVQQQLGLAGGECGGGKESWEAQHCVRVVLWEGLLCAHACVCACVCVCVYM